MAPKSTKKATSKSTKKAASKSTKKSVTKPTSKSKAVRTDGVNAPPEKRRPTGIEPEAQYGRNSFFSYLDGTSRARVKPNYYETTGDKVPKQRQTTPYQMSTRPPKRGTNTKRVVVTETWPNKKHKKLITQSAQGGRPLRTLNKKPERSDPFYNSKTAQKLGHAATEAVFKSNLRDWNNVNKGVIATPNKKPTAAQKKYTATQKLRKKYAKRSK
mgnify:CR=1 FL=1